MNDDELTRRIENLEEQNELLRKSILELNSTIKIINETIALQKDSIETIMEIIKLNAM